MNNRIIELMDQAGFYNMGIWNIIGIQEYHEKFAELIIKECVSQCWTVSELEHKGDVVYQCSKRIQKHFGVE